MERSDLAVVVEGGVGKHFAFSAVLKQLHEIMGKDFSKKIH